MRRASVRISKDENQVKVLLSETRRYCTVPGTLKNLNENTGCDTLLVYLVVPPTATFRPEGGRFSRVHSM
jgi:hypothetical protein